MRVALIGDHPDGLALAVAFHQTGRHELARYAGPKAGVDRLNQSGLVPIISTDVEEVLADPRIDLLIVADDAEHRADVLRRVVRAERHVLCVHPADVLPDITYEASMVQQETKQVLLPILSATLNPGLGRLRELWTAGMFGAVETIEGEFPLPRPENDTAPAAKTPAKKATKHRPAGNWDPSPLVTLWAPLRFLGGEVREVSALGVEGDVLKPSDPLTLTGRFTSGVLFQVLLTSGSGMQSKVSVRGSQGTATLVIKEGRPQRTELQWTAGEQQHVENWEWDPWPAFVTNFESFLAGKPSPVSWLDGTRCLELFEAVRQSVRRRRVIPMQYEEFSEASSFKTLMTTLGCLVLLLVLAIFVVLLAVGAPLAPWSLYLLVPLLGLFLILQALAWVVPREGKTPPPAPPSKGGERRSA